MCRRRRKVRAVTSGLGVVVGWWGWTGAGWGWCVCLSRDCIGCIDRTYVCGKEEVSLNLGGRPGGVVFVYR